MTTKHSILLWVFVAAIATLLCTLPSCSQKRDKNHNKEQIVVTIPPLQGLVEEIVGDDFEVSALLPTGSSPESYSPTPSQLVKIEQAEVVFYVGTLDFEQVIMKRFARKNVNNLVDCSKGVTLIEGSCMHGRHRKHDENKAQHHHHHGSDPHIWLSPYELEVVAKNIGQAICALYPDSSKYVANSEKLIAQIRARQEAYGTQLTQANTKMFLIYHPALGYLARDYGLEQVSLEHEGKVPTPVVLANIAEKLAAEEATLPLLYQAEYPENIVKPLAEILNVNLLKINPLSSNILAEMDRIINTISTTENGTN